MDCPKSPISPKRTLGRSIAPPKKVKDKAAASSKTKYSKATENETHPYHTKVNFSDSDDTKSEAK